MQTKRMIPVLLSLFISTMAVAQNPAYTTTVNNTKLPEATPSFQVSISAGKVATSFSLWIQNPEQKKLRLQISHRSLGELIDTVVASESFSQRYNMEQADDGQYIITISCGKEKIVKQIELNTITTRNVVVN